MLRNILRRLLSKKEIAVALVVLLAISTLPLPAHAETVTQARYLGSYGFQHYSLDGFSLFGLRNLTDMDVFDFYYRNHTGTYNGNVQIGFRAYRNIYDSNYAYTQQYEELTSGVTLLWEKANNFEGWATTTWTSSEMNFSRLDTIQLELWTRARTSAVAWSAWAIFLNDNGIQYNTAQLHTESLCMDKLLSSDWNFTFYLKCWRETVPSIKRVVRIYCGNSTYDSRIENMQFDNGVSAIEESELPIGLAVGGLFAGFIGVMVLAIKKRR